MGARSRFRDRIPVPILGPESGPLTIIHQVGRIPVPILGPESGPLTIFHQAGRIPVPKSGPESGPEIRTGIWSILQIFPKSRSRNRVRNRDRNLIPELGPESKSIGFRSRNRGRIPIFIFLKENEQSGMRLVARVAVMGLAMYRLVRRAGLVVKLCA